MSFNEYLLYTKMCVMFNTKNNLIKVTLLRKVVYINQLELL